MTEGMSWVERLARYRVVTAEPTERDLFVVTLLDGKIADVQPAERYKAALWAAEALIKNHDVALKVLPVTFRELVELHGMDYAAFMKERPAPRPDDIAFRKALTDRLMQIVGNEHAEPRVRTDAFNLLRQAGKIHG